ncbi:hypothetical protein A6A06_23755 [Streptomyces sp. CB02923]|uniref:MFS transporter n=1 Tax=Streptomyces sp. CB02923 TaxID=1718985 RepID=UPI00093B01A1|nr:MFS transporter [Streptomyces sp. CB02923]OKI00181.1 hypothetical protein A6A06_23755 [Streptomyces sp. CB02923]
MRPTRHLTGPTGPTDTPVTSPSSRSLLLLLAVGVFAIGTDGYVIAGLLTDMAHDLHVTEGAAGRLVTVFALAYAIGAPLLGAATGGLRRRTVLVGSLGLFAATNLAAALVDSYAAMLAVRVAAALAAALFTPAAAAAAPALVPAERRGRALATVGAGMAAATAAGVPLGTLIGGAFGWRATFLAVAALGAAAAAGTALLLPADTAATASGAGAGAGAGGGAGGGPGSRLAVLRVPGVPSALGVSVLWIAGAFTVLTYIGPVLAEVGGVRGTALSLWLLVFGLAAVAGNALGGRFADRHPTPWLTVVCTAGLTVALAALGLLGALGAHGATGAAWAAVALAVWGVFGWAFAPAQQHRLVGLAPEAPGLILALNASATYAGISLGGLLGSLGLAHAGAAGAGLTATAIELLAVAAAAAVALRSARAAVAPTEQRPYCKPASRTCP